MNHEQLRSFAVFADHLNFTRAARQLHVSQPALHVQIRKLGEAVGHRLYTRTGNTLALTAAGVRLAAFGRELRAREAELLDELRGVATAGPVGLAAGQGAFLYLLGPAVRRFPASAGRLRLLPLPGPDAIAAVREARAQVAVVATDDPPDDLAATPLRAVGQHVIVPAAHRLARRRSLRPAELAGEPLVVAPPGTPHRAMVAQLLHGVPWTAAVEATGWELMLHFARLGAGAAIVNDFCPPPRGTVAIALPAAPAITYRLLRRRGLASRATDALAALIVETTRT